VIPSLTYEEFVKWLKEAGKTRSFWTRPIDDISLETADGEISFRVVWATRER